MKIRKTETGTWCYDFTFSGKRHIVAGFDSKEQADSAAAVKRGRLLDEKHGISSPITDLRFNKLADEYYRKVSANKRSWRRDRLSLDHLERAFRGKKVSEITAPVVEDYKERRFKDVSGPTINREISLLSNVFTTAIRWHYAASNPVKGVSRYEENEPVERPLLPGEEERLLAAAAPHLKTILIILLNTGMRRNELLSLRWKNVNLTAGHVVIQKTNSKNKRMRIVPLNAAAMAALRGIPRRHELVFYNPKTKRSLKEVRTAFLAACGRAGIEGLRLHDLRHTFATRLRDEHVDLATIMKLLGHSTIAMTLRYAHSSEKNEHDAVNKLLAPSPKKQDIPVRNPEIQQPAYTPAGIATLSYCYN
ncbi:MAG: site-specific integrase [Candidatus Aureabacteria bacterium]|nr:site-specific integrase [Candidatus Auribacterota bacterium]